MYTLPNGPTAPLPTCLPPSPGHGRPPGTDQRLFTSEHRAWPGEKTRKMLRTGRAAGDASLQHPCHAVGSNPEPGPAPPSLPLLPQGRITRTSGPQLLGTLERWQEQEEMSFPPNLQPPRLFILFSAALRV